MPRTSYEAPATSGSGGGHVVEDEGTPVTQRANLNFTGSGVTVADTGGKTVVTVPSSTGGQLWIFRDETGGTWPLRSTVSSDATVRVTWLGSVAPAIGGGYMQAQDLATSKPGDVWEEI
jgi:hypothetical protein